MASAKVNTITIDDFTGEITPELIGTLNSGKCPISLNPSGKNPFSNPYLKKGLQFLEGSYSLVGDNITSPILHTIKAFINNPIVSGVGMDGTFYNIGVANVAGPTPDLDSVVKYTNSIADTLNYGGGLYYDGGQKILLVGTDGGAYVSTANPLANPTTATFSAVTGSWNLSGVPRPICFFLGTAYVGDGEKLVSLTSNYSAIASNSVLTPTLPTGYCIRNLQVSNDGRYMIIVASVRTSTNDFKISDGQQPQYQPIDSVILYWNGTDVTYSSFQFFKGLNIVTVVSSSTDTVMFAKDLRGTGIFSLDGNRLASIEDVTEDPGLPLKNFASYPPSLYSVDTVGKMFFFLFQMGQNLFIYLYDSETQKLYSILEDSRSTTGSIVGGLAIASVHSNAIISNAWAEVTRAKLYYFNKNIGGGSPSYLKTALHLQNYGGNISGSYYTQFQEFGRKVRPVSMRVFTLPTSSGVSFSARLLDIALNNLINKSYTYAAGTDITQAQGALTKIEFSVSCKPVSSFAFNLVPNNQSAFFVEKVEIDYIDVENPPAN